MARQCQIVTVEEHVLAGIWSAVLELLNDHGVSIPVKRFGVKDTFIEHASRLEQLKLCGLDEESLKVNFYRYFRLNTSSTINKIKSE